MSDQSEQVKELKILKEDVNYYIVDPVQAIGALSNYHRNKRIDKFLDLSKTKEIVLDAKTKFKKKEYLQELQFKTLFKIQRDLERLNSKLVIVNMNAQSITRRLQSHGDKLSAAEMKQWTTNWNQLSKEYDLLVDQLEKKTEESREKVLLYLFGINKTVLSNYYTKLLDYADAFFLTLINMYNSDDNIRVGDVIGPLVNPELPDPTEKDKESLTNHVKANITDRIDKVIS